MQFSTPFSDRRYLVPVRRYSRSKCEIRNFDVFGPPNFLGEGPPKFFTHIKKLQSPPNIWQSLVTIGPETSEIRRRKKSMIETSAVKYNGRRPASWRAAIIISLALFSLKTEIKDIQEILDRWQPYRFPHVACPILIRLYIRLCGRLYALYVCHFSALWCSLIGLSHFLPFRRLSSAWERLCASMRQRQPRTFSTPYDIIKPCPQWRL